MLPGAAAADREPAWHVYAPLFAVDRASGQFAINYGRRVAELGLEKTLEMAFARRGFRGHPLASGLVLSLIEKDQRQHIKPTCEELRGTLGSEVALFAPGHIPANPLQSALAFIRECEGLANFVAALVRGCSVAELSATAAISKESAASYITCLANSGLTRVIYEYTCRCLTRRKNIQASSQNRTRASQSTLQCRLAFCHRGLTASATWRRGLARQQTHTHSCRN